MSSWLAIASVATASEPPPQKALAQLLGLEEASVVPLVDRLVKQQLLAVQPKEDRRKRLLVLTEQGGEAFTVKTQADALRAQLLADIDPAALAVTETCCSSCLNA